MDLPKIAVEVTAFGETRTIECYAYGEDRGRLDSVGQLVVGRFPTGTKLHRSQLTLWKREQPTGRALTGKTAAVVNGAEYIASTTLYTHNRNVGRITGWYTEATPEGVIARW